jgi:hypothetical protein
LRFAGFASGFRVRFSMLCLAASRGVSAEGGGAVADEPTAARWFQAASPATVHVWVVPHAGHTQGLATQPRGWEAHVIAFLNTALHPGTTTAATAAADAG